ncbi:diacylglycerol kinase [Marinicella rhabdoformis]|uniref:diacylglycerol kinase n=1 Tax=Marinicella rhabdoformis TaxID=2580566 RepID=UPI0012AEBB5A|nr:diacylglycerol kinase [Marinicella rhabdoformis]
MPASGFRGLKQLIKAGQWSVQGLKAAYQNEASFRLEVYLFVILIPLAIWLAESSTQLLLLLGSAWLVLLVEILNSALEAVVDLVCGEEKHKLAGRAKDMGSAAVFLASLLTLATWAVVIYQVFS